MALTITYKLEFSDQLEALRYHHRLQTALVGVVLVGMGAAFWIMQGKWYLLALVLAYVLVGRPYLVRRRLWRDWNRRSLGGGPETTYEFDENGMHGVDETGQRMTTSWAQFHRVHESASLFLLYLSPRVFLCFPKRALSVHEQGSLRRLLREHVGPRLPEGSDI